MDTIERKYALRNMDGGLYLLLSNDGRRLYVLQRYDEDGSAQRQRDDGSWYIITGTHWRAFRVTDAATARGPQGEAMGIREEYLFASDDDPNDPYARASLSNLISDSWAFRLPRPAGAECISDVCPTRREVVQDALRDAERQAALR
jgi:hypothetical protein